MGVAVMGVGFAGAFPTSDGLSYRELIVKAALMAYRDAGVDPEQLDGAVSVEEDFVSGYSIADEYVPDQLGVVRKPVYTICGDYLHGVGSAVMQIETGRFDIVVVEAYSKASNILLKDELLHFALDPIFDRMGVSPHYLAALEMQRYFEETGYDVADAALVVSRNKEAALQNPAAAWAADSWPADVLAARPVATPLTESMLARHADGAVVIVLGTDEAAAAYSRNPVFITGTGWGSGTSITARRDTTTSVGTQLAAGHAMSEAGITDPQHEIDLFYVSDLYPHRQLMHMDALGLAGMPDLVVNPDGGSLGMGDLLEANGGVRLVDAVRQLRGEAGAHQIDGAERALVHGWRGVPTDSCAVVVLETERRSA
jgi:acetyl-CoA C-acetyltransferase